MLVYLATMRPSAREVFAIICTTEQWMARAITFRLLFAELLFDHIIDLCNPNTTTSSPNLFPLFLISDRVLARQAA
uniref:Secreted protein n=1 Tax=Steinernema glaseri TaxID=37863 RepID=A0A1I8A410_9BILA